MGADRRRRVSVPARNWRRIGAHAFQHQRRVRPATRAAPDRRVARSIAFSSMPDAILVSGGITGRAAGESTIAEVADALAGTDVPLLVNTGFNRSNAADLLQYADGAIVGTSLKLDGITWNPVDRARVRELIEVVDG
ncbi:MAG: BtpA/SgcQ family protein [Thermomicrobiales bacterium]